LVKNVFVGVITLIIGLAVGFIIPKYLEEEKNVMLIYALQNKEEPSKVVVSIQIFENSEAWLVYRFSLKNKGEGTTLMGFPDEEWSSFALEGQKPEYFNTSADFENKFRLRYIEPK
jgi:hypothetical protein